MTNAVPKDFSTVTAVLAVEGAEKAIELYKKAFGATVDDLMKCPQTGKVMHATLTIGDSKLMLSDTFPEKGCSEATTSNFCLYIKDVDAAFKKASAASLKEKMAPEDMFWGDRMGAVTDPFGNTWSLATHVRDLSKGEIEKGAKEWASKKAA